METQTENSTRKFDGLAKITLGHAFSLAEITPENAIVVGENGTIELISRTIPYQTSKEVLVCTLSRRDGTILEKGYNYQQDGCLHLAHENLVRPGDFSYQRHASLLKEKLGE